MKNTLLPFLLAALLMLPVQAAFSAVTDDPPITITIPEAVIGRALTQTLPLTLAGDSERLEGTITIVDISDVKLDDTGITCHIELTGKDLSLITSVADQDIRLKLGNAAVDFDSEAQLRFDEALQTLYITPVAQGIEAENALEDGDIGKALLLFLNGREFPVALQDIRPMVARASDKIITIDTHIIDISAGAGLLEIRLLPEITTRPRP